MTLAVQFKAVIREASRVVEDVEYWTRYCKLAAVVRLSLAAVHVSVKEDAVVAPPLTAGSVAVGGVLSTVTATAVLAAL